MIKKSALALVVSLLLAITMALGACAPKATPAPVAPAAPIATTSPTAPAVPVQAKSAAEQEWDKVLAAARKEGSLNFYTTFAPPELKVAMSKAMQENYGIKMEWLVSTGGVNAERIRVEHKAKQYVADAWWPGASVLLTRELRAVSALKPFTPPMVSREPGVWRGKGIDSFTEERDAVTIAQRTTALFVVNSNMVRPEDYPKAYKDLLDPKWKGKIVMQDPTVPGGGSATFGQLKREYGLEFWEKMSGQNISFIRDFGELARRVAIGESLAAVGLNIPAIMPFLVAGAPIKLIAPVEGGIRTNGVMYTINNAPHPNAGKVFINWVLTKEGQEMLSRLAGEEPIRSDVEHKTHPDLANLTRSMPKWLIYDWKVSEEFDADVAAGTARKIFGLK